MTYYGNWNWKNCWRITFILILLSIFFDFLNLETVSKIFCYIGGVAFIIMLVVRFDDWRRII